MTPESRQAIAKVLIGLYKREDWFIAIFKRLEARIARLEKKAKPGRIITFPTSWGRVRFRAKEKGAKK